MNRIGIVRIAALFVLLLGFSTQAEAGKLSTQLGEVVIENLQVGQTYNLLDLARLNLAVTNGSDVRVKLGMEVLIPGESELKQNAEPVPDKSWVQLSQNLFMVDPGQKAESDILISIPDEDKYLGRKYQVMIWSHTLPDENGGMFLACGLKSRIIFTIAEERAASDDIAAVSDADVRPAVTPEEIRLEGVVPGTPFDVEQQTGTVLIVTNQGDSERTFKLRSQTVEESSATLTTGYEDVPDAAYLTFSEPEFALDPGESKPVKLFLDIPDSEDVTGNRYMIIIYGFTEGDVVTTGTYSRLYVSLE